MISGHDVIIGVAQPLESVKSLVLQAIQGKWPDMEVEPDTETDDRWEAFVYQDREALDLWDNVETDRDLEATQDLMVHVILEPDLLTMVFGSTGDFQEEITDKVLRALD
jgi:hypothetical protein